MWSSRTARAPDFRSHTTRGSRDQYARVVFCRMPTRWKNRTTITCWSPRTRKSLRWTRVQTTGATARKPKVMYTYLSPLARSSHTINARTLGFSTELRRLVRPFKGGFSNDGGHSRLSDFRVFFRHIPMTFAETNSGGRSFGLWP